MESRTREKPMRKAGRENVLLISASESDADLYYATGFLVGDPVIYLEIGGRKLLLVGDLEYGRACKEAQVDEVVSSAPLEDRLRAAGEKPRLARVADLYLRELGVKELAVSPSLSFFHAEQLRELGYTLTCREDPFFPERLVKTPEEVEAIAASQRAAEEAMAFVVDTIRKSEIRGDSLYHRGKSLTAEWLRRETHKLLLDEDHHAVHTIIAGGDLGCDPHQRGHGPLPAHRTIIVDIFPRSLASRYWGDITRTVVRGRASREVKKLYEDVLGAQEQAVKALRHGADGQNVHQGVVEFFESRGNRNESLDGVRTGFIHSTGHGIGLDIHEPPKIGKSPAKIEAGYVVTVEPGLYYPGIGAVRLEDLVVVTENGCRNLTSFPKELEL
jgi:Xaa-Pro aminopeptidase